MNQETATGPGRYEPALALTDIYESKHNPRKHFDPVALQELEASIRAKGVLTPVLVRPNGKGYELAAGHRRLRAARSAGLASLPARVLPMTDTELLEVLVIENDQREDVHPLEEADGYRRLLMPGTGYDVAKVAARVGRSPKYVYDRLKLLDLVQKAQELFLAGRFTAGHAILLARLGAKDQERAIAIEDRDFYGGNGALFKSDGGLFADDEEKAARKNDPHVAMKPVSVREFERWITEHVKFDRHNVDPMLFPEAAEALAAAAEEKRKVVPITREYRAGDDVRGEGKERIYGEQAWKRADGKEKSKTCDQAIVGTIVCGPGQGEVFPICIAKEKCATHWSAWQKERKAREKAAATGGDARDRYARDAAEHKARQEQEEVERGRWAKARPAVMQALAAAVKIAPTKATGFLAKLIVDGLANYRSNSSTVARLVPRGQTAEDLVRHAAMIVIASQAHDGWRAEDELVPLAKALNIDARKIRDEVAPAPKPEVQTAAAPATGASTKAPKQKAAKKDEGKKDYTAKIAGARDMDSLVGLQVTVEAAQGELPGVEAPDPEQPKKKRGKDAAVGTD